MRESKNLLGYCFTGILTMYLSIQFHECFHWAIGRILNVGIIVGLYTASHQNIPDWKSMMIDAGGAIITLIFELIGFALYRMKRETWKSFGLSLLFVVSIGRILYEFSGIVILPGPTKQISLISWEYLTGQYEQPFLYSAFFYSVI
jgi:hypothetical protein